MRSLVLLPLFFSVSLLSLFCNPADLRNPGDTKSEAFRDRLLWQEFIRPVSVCNTTSFEYAPSYRSTSVKEALTPLQIVQTKDKSIYVFGIATFAPELNLGTFSGTEDNASSRNATLFKFSETGVLQWTRTLGLANTAGNAIGMIESDSGVYLTFTASSSVGSPLTSFVGSGGNIAVFHISKDGSILWNTYFGNASGNNKSYTIAKLSGGDLIIGGESNSTGLSGFSGANYTLNGSIPQNSALVMRLTSNGTGVWIHYFAGATAANIRTVERLAVSSSDVITTFGFEREPLASGYFNVVQNHSGSIPRKEYLIAQFESSGLYLRHTFLLTLSGQASPILPNPRESEVAGEMIFAGTTSAEFQGLSSVKVRNYQGNYDQYIAKLNSALNVSYVTYLGGPGDDQGSIYKIFKDARNDSYFAFSPFLYDPNYGSGYPGLAGYPTLGLVKVGSTGSLLEYGFKAETEFNIPYMMSDTCDGGIIIGYYIGDSISNATSTFAKFRLTKMRPMIPIYHEYSNPFFTFAGK